MLKEGRRTFCGFLWRVDLSPVPSGQRALRRQSLLLRLILRKLVGPLADETSGLKIVLQRKFEMVSRANTACGKGSGGLW